MQRSLFNHVLMFGCSLLVLTSCQSTRMARRPVTVQFQPQEIRAVSIQESFSRTDELMMAYSLSVLNDKNELVSTQNGAWGVEKVKKGDVIRTFQPLSIQVPYGSRAVVTLVLMEIEDYSRAQKLVNDVRKYTGMAGAVAGFFQATELTNPVGYLLLSLQAAGVALNHSNQLDPDDMLGSFSQRFTFEELKALKQPLKIPLHFSKDSRMDRYEYRLAMQVTATR